MFLTEENAYFLSKNVLENRNFFSVCGDIVMTQVVSIRLKASWGRSAGAPGRGRQDK